MLQAFFALGAIGAIGRKRIDFLELGAFGKPRTIRAEVPILRAGCSSEHHKFHVQVLFRFSSKPCETACYHPRLLGENKAKRSLIALQPQ
jgi:hypothetical protein